MFEESTNNSTLSKGGTEESNSQELSSGSRNVESEKSGFDVVKSNDKGLDVSKSLGASVFSERESEVRVRKSSDMGLPSAVLKTTAVEAIQMKRSMVEALLSGF